MRVCVCVCVCMLACVCVCACMLACVCVCACMCERSHSDDPSALLKFKGVSMIDLHNSI